MADTKLPRIMIYFLVLLFNTPYKSTYRNLNDIFIRSKKRIHAEKTLAYISPADSTCKNIQLVNNLQLANNNFDIDVKNIKYSYLSLFGPSIYKIPLDRPIWFVNLYLSPLNIHQIYAPIDLIVMRSYHYPGNVCPIKLRACDESKNEKMILECSTRYGLCLIGFIGSFGVGSISLSFDVAARNVRILAGQNLGHFNIGSTIVMLFNYPAVAPRIRPADKISIGQKLFAEPSILN